MCERAFSALTHMKTKYRSRLNVESDRWVCLKQIAPKIDELCKVKQTHPSHQRINCIRIILIVIVSELGDKSNVTYIWSPQRSRFAKKGPRSKKLGNPGIDKGCPTCGPLHC